MIFMTRLPLPNPDLLAMSRRLSPFPIFYFLLVRKSRIISFFRSPGSLPFDTSLLILAQGADVVRLVEIGMVEVPKSVENFSHCFRRRQDFTSADCAFRVL